MPAESSRPATPAPGDIARGTQETGTPSADAPSSRSLEFAARQSFGDPAHRTVATRLAIASEEE